MITAQPAVSCIKENWKWVVKMIMLPKNKLFNHGANMKKWNIKSRHALQNVTVTADICSLCMKMDIRYLEMKHPMKDTKNLNTNTKEKQHG